MTLSKSKVIKSNICRRRTGCLTCRERRIRCGEEKPNCNNCLRKSRLCKWAKDGDRFLYHPLSIGYRPQSYDEQSFKESRTKESENAFANKKSPQHESISTTPPHQDTFAQLPTPTVSTASATNDPSSSLPDSWHLDPEYPNRQVRFSSRRSSNNSNSEVSVEELACWRSEVLESFNNDYASGSNDFARSTCRSESARLKEHIDLEHESSIPPNLEPNAELFSDWRTIGASDIVVAALSGDQEIKLLQVYLRECAHWFDAFDRHRHYSRKGVARMMTCPPWRAAALALSAKHMEMHGKLEQSDPLSLHLYQLAVQLAIDSISGRFDCIGTTAGCVVLAVYEMMTVAYQDWRRHLRGCTSIYSHNRWNGDSLGLIGASFWNYARIDIWAAFCVGTTTMLATNKWFSNSEKVLRSVSLDEDRHAHLATWLLARVNNLIHDSSVFLASNMNEDFSLLKHDLEKWKCMGSEITQPILQQDADPSLDHPLPSILYSSEGCAVAHILWHTACVLLLEFELSKQNIGHDDISHKIYKHATIVCGIIETHCNSRSVLIDSIQPLWICGRHLCKKSEKFVVLELLAKIERETGWRTHWRGESLREVWNMG